MPEMGTSAAATHECCRQESSGDRAHAQLAVCPGAQRQTSLRKRSGGEGIASNKIRTVLESHFRHNQLEMSTQLLFSLMVLHFGMPEHERQGTLQRAESTVGKCTGCYGNVCQQRNSEAV